MFFDGSMAGHCKYHTSMPLFSYGSNIGRYPCCNKEAIRFDTAAQNDGCKHKYHLIELPDPVSLPAFEYFIDVR